MPRNPNNTTKEVIPLPGGGTYTKITTRITTYGGKRAGAGRPSLGKQPLSLKVTQSTRLGIEILKDEYGIRTLSGVIERLVTEEMKKIRSKQTSQEAR